MDHQLLLCSTDLHSADPNPITRVKDNIQLVTSVGGYQACVKPAALAPCSRDQSTSSVHISLALPIFVLPCLAKGLQGSTHTLMIQIQRGIRQGFAIPVYAAGVLLLQILLAIKALLV